MNSPKCFFSFLWKNRVCESHISLSINFYPPSSPSVTSIDGHPPPKLIYPPPLPTPPIDSPLPPSAVPPFPPVTWRLAVTRRSLGVVAVSLWCALETDEKLNARNSPGAPFLFSVCNWVIASISSCCRESAEVAGKRYSAERVIFSHPAQRWVSGSRLWERVVLRCE